MKKHSKIDITCLDVDHSLFSGKREDKVVTLSFREKPLLHLMDLAVKKILFEYLDRIAGCDAINVLLIKEAPTKMRREEYIAFYKGMIESGICQIQLERMYNAVGQLILKLVGLNKMIVHVDSGAVILLFMNIGLACDYRIVADDAVFQNPNIELGVVPKGGSAFLLSKMLGAVSASKILLSGRDINATRARQLGIVDKVVPLRDIDQGALETARSFAQIPTGYAISVKKLLNYDIKALAGFLEFENELLRKLVGSYQSHTRVA